jgi:hypothetical protein
MVRVCKPRRFSSYGPTAFDVHCPTSAEPSNSGPRTPFPPRAAKRTRFPGPPMRALASSVPPSEPLAEPYRAAAAAAASEAAAAASSAGVRLPADAALVVAVQVNNLLS